MGATKHTLVRGYKKYLVLLLSEPLLSCACVNILKIKNMHLRTYISAPFASTANVAKIILPPIIRVLLYLFVILNIVSYRALEQ